MRGVVDMLKPRDSSWFFFMPYALNEKNDIVHNTKETRERGEPDGHKPDTKRGQPRGAAG